MLLVLNRFATRFMRGSVSAASHKTGMLERWASCRHANLVLGFGHETIRRT